MSAGNRSDAFVCKPIQKCAKLSGGRPNVHQICQLSKVGFGVHSRHLPKTRAVYIEGTKIRQMKLAHVAVHNTSPIFWGSVGKANAGARRRGCLASWCAAATAIGALHLAWPCGRRGGIRASAGRGACHPCQQGQARSPAQELFETHADAFAPWALAPRDASFQGWPAGTGEDRPL
jgi:hypothetical protein